MTPRHSPTAYLFDLDGTLVDSFRAIQASVNHVRDHLGLTPLPLNDVRAAVGRGLRKLMELTIPVGTPESNYAIFQEHHPSVIAEGTDLLPGVRETLAELHRRSAKLGVCSNKPLALSNQVLAAMGLTQYFASVFGPERCAFPKPAPDMLLGALQELQVAARDALYVGDMTIDIETAKAAGVEVWVVPSGTQSREVLAAASPQRILNDFAEILSSPFPAAPRID
jgi:2-phosphoglycolate phosphatase